MNFGWHGKILDALEENGDITEKNNNIPIIQSDKEDHKSMYCNSLTEL